MDNQIPLSPSSQLASQRLFSFFALTTLFSVWGAIALDEVMLLGIPFFLLLVFQTLIDYKVVYLLLWATIPISTEVFLPNGMATDLPDEPLIVGLMLVFLLQVITRPESLNPYFFAHPATLLLLGGFVWTVFTTLYSANVIVSVKWTLSKFWYIATFFLLAGHIIRGVKEVKQIWWWMLIPFLLAVFKVFAHHFMLDFGFREINRATSPFFRNHVNYAAMIALVLPFLYMMRHWYAKFTFRWWFVLGAIVFLFGALIFAYTRAAYVALIMAMGAYWVIRFKLVRWVLVGATLGIVAVFLYLVSNNRFLYFAPTERTIAHESLNDILSATSKLEDVSTMERYYRWIAGVRMANEDLYTGFGAGNFHGFYKGHTLHKFETYVSDNPEKSSIHNYYLMLLVEQGVLGMLLFIALNFYVLIFGERLYHRLTDSVEKSIVMGSMLSIIVIYAFLLMNDMIETDKVGSFFFLHIAVLVVFDIKHRGK